MSQAIKLALRAEGRTSPNPLVGAIVVRDDEIVGEGYHQKAGTPHAEVHAIRTAGNNSKGATLYVTLEPCNHFGRTPPCTEGIIEAGIDSVIIANQDPNPLVAGQGIQRLRDAGIEVKVGLLSEEAIKINQPFFKFIKTGLPLVALKTAMTLDGKIATSSGDSKWITGESARHYVHQLRNTYDAILVGIGTVLKDDPLLNTRLSVEDKRDPVRVIIDTDLEISLNSQIVKTANDLRTIVFCESNAPITKKDALQSRGIEIIELAASVGLIPLESVLTELGKMNICSLLVEGGGEINGYLLGHSLIDRVYWFIAPKFVGGRTAPSPIGGKGIDSMNDALQIKSMDMHRIDQDILLTGTIKEWY